MAFAGASRVPAKGEEPAFESSPDFGNGFNIRFVLPFSRADIYKELLNATSPLGSSPSASFTIMRPGHTEGEQVSPGCIRKATFAAPFYGETVSELTVADAGAADGSGVATIKWRQLEASTRLNLIGLDGKPSEFTVELEGDPGFGTLVIMTYNFATAEMQGPLSFLGCMLPQLLQYHLHSSIVSVWHMEMVRCARALE